MFYTYQDLQQIPPDDEQRRMAFVRKVISQHQNSDLYQNAQLGDEYDRGMDRTITQYRKLLYDVQGRAVPDNYSASYKLSSKFFGRFTNQLCQTLLGNGITFKNEATKKRLGNDFDARCAQIAKLACDGAVCYGFYNLDHVEVFPVYSTVLPCFAPLQDEETGATSAGVRFWRMVQGKPLRATMFELDGYTDYIWRSNEEGEVLTPKRPYIVSRRGDKIDAKNGTMEYIGENYPSFPIVPLWANPLHQSELVGLRESIDCYDLIKSGFANTVDEASLLYWTMTNAGGMDDVDLSKFLQRLRTVKAAVVEDGGAKIESHAIDVPYQSREAILNRLEDDLFRDAMAVNTDKIASGNVTATQIRAAYDAHNSKVDQFELCVIDFIQGILAVAGIEDTPTFTRSIIANQSEQMQTLMQAAQYLPSDYVTRKALEIMGDGDLADGLLKEMDAENANRLKEAEARLKELEEQDNKQGNEGEAVE